jgi:hypothetical protein
MIKAFILIMNQTLTIRKSEEEGQQKCHSLGAAEYLVPALRVACTLLHK